MTQSYNAIVYAQNGYFPSTTIKNNLFYLPGGNAAVSMPSASYSAASLNGVDSLKSGNIAGDPQFKALGSWNAAQNYDFSLQAGSPAIGLALASDAPSTDIRRVNRDANPDAGAYEATGGVVTAPTLLSISPSSMKRGTSGTVTLTGTNFGNGSSVSVANRWVNVSATTVISSTQITAVFSVARWATVGNTNVTVTTPGAGASNAVTFTVIF